MGDRGEEVTRDVPPENVGTPERGNSGGMVAVRQLQLTATFCPRTSPPRDSDHLHSRNGSAMYRRKPMYSNGCATEPKYGVQGVAGSNPAVPMTKDIVAHRVTTP